MRPVDAEYVDGLLKPEHPLPLRSGERVALIVLRKPEPSRWDLERLTEHTEEDLLLAEIGMAEWCKALDEEDRL